MRLEFCSYMNFSELGLIHKKENLEEFDFETFCYHGNWAGYKDLEKLKAISLLTWFIA